TPDKIKFVRIDADVDGALKDGESAEDSVLADIFKTALADDKISVKFEKLKSADVPAVIVVDEYMRRYSEMGKYYGMSDGEPNKTLIVNLACPVVAKLKEIDEEKQSFVAGYVYSLALASFKKLSPEELDKFQKDSLKLLDCYTK
ncbi:MAG: hypothetical protein K2N68_03870, partial [Clostridia bacterium]|nr:hypothetical protein [Clostridia bacterium]